MQTFGKRTESTDVFAISYHGVTFRNVADIRAAIRQARAELMEDKLFLMRFQGKGAEEGNRIALKIERQCAAMLYAIEHLTAFEELPLPS